MKINQILLIIFLAVISFPMAAQIEGDAIFGEDQIVTIELDFPETNFWNTLTTNYEDATYTWANLTITDSSGDLIPEIKKLLR